MPTSPTALVVDDEPDIRRILVSILRKQGFDLHEAADGEAALAARAANRPDVLFLDVMMPKMTGLEALERIREEDPDLPVVIVSASGEPEIVDQALRLGAMNFVHKPFDREEIAFVVRRIRAALDEEADVAPVQDLVQERRTVLSIGNDTSVLSKVVAWLGRELRFHYPVHEVGSTEVKLALYEAMANAVEHGNLEIGFDEKTRATQTPEGVLGLVERRRREAPFRDRKVRVEASYGAGEVTYRIRDEGPGYRREEHEARSKLDVTALHGRGLMLIRHYMTRVEWNDAGNEIVMSRTIRPRGAHRNGSAA